MEKKLEDCLAALRDAAEESVSSRGGGGGGGGGSYDSDNLSLFVSDLSDICKELVGSSEEHTSFAVAILFDEEIGIFSILECIMRIRDKSVAKAREDCLKFVEAFVKQIGGRALPHAAFLKEHCLRIFRRDDVKGVQAAALKPLTVLLEWSISHSKQPPNFSVDWGLANVLIVEFRQAKSHGTLRSHIIVLLGYLVESFKTAFSEDQVNQLLQLCLNTLEAQLQQPSHTLLAGAMKCLDSLLTWFDDELPAGGSVVNSRRCFEYIEQVLWPREDLKRYEALRVTLRLLSRHMNLFTLKFLEEGPRNLKWLQSYCTHTNAVLRDAALPAYDRFLVHGARALVSDKRVQNAQQVYTCFIRDALEVLNSQGVDPMRVSLAIRTIGKLAAPIAKFSGKGSLKEAFHRLQPFGGSLRAGEARNGSLGHAVTLVGAFADIVLHLDDVEDFMVYFIAEVTGDIYYQVPQLFPKQKQAVYTTLRSLFKALHSKGAFFTLFLNAVVWSSLERSMEPVETAPGEAEGQLWQHYVDLWFHLLDFSVDEKHANAQNSDGEDDEEEGSKELVSTDIGDVGIDTGRLRESMFDAILHCVIKAMRELNLKYRVKPTGSSAPSEDTEVGAMEPETEMDAIEPLNPLHMRKFLNLVEFVQDLLSGPFANLFLKWTYPFGRTIIELSSGYPLISGFYKLLAVTIKLADSKNYFLPGCLTSSGGDNMQVSQDIEVDINGSSSAGAFVSREDRRLCMELFHKYLQEVLVASKRYKLELLAACLRLCLSAPPALIEIAPLIQPMRNALKIGLRYPPLGAVAMDALERWQMMFPKELQRWLPQIVPCFNDYLVQVETTEVSESENVVDSPAAASKSASVGTISRAQLMRIRQARIKESQPGPFELVQVRVQKFLGRIGGFAHLLVSSVDLLQLAGTGGLAWDPVDRVKFTLPFRDMKPDIWLDSLLPRIVELALSSSDRRTKVTASELLHAICLLMLGIAAKGPTRRRNEELPSVHFDKLYRQLFPAVLQLATDVELVTRQLFREFAKQLTHWLTSNQQKENPETMALLDAILDGLVDPENGSLREFCADCFAEFMCWSVRHALPEADNFANVTSMLRRVYNRMDHPNPYHRLGAAMAAHRMYPVLRENGAIVDRHIFEILFFCIKSLRLAETDDEQTGTVKQLSKSLDLLQRLIQRNITALQCKRKDRLLFLSLGDFLEWLFHQTGQINEKCRNKCMNLFSFICLLSPEGSSASWVQANIFSGAHFYQSLKPFDLEMEYTILPEKHLFSLQPMQLWLTHLMRTLHWFEWALREKIVKVEELVEGEKTCSLHIMAGISRFLQGLLLSQYLSLHLSDLTPSERESFGVLTCKVVTCLLNLCNQLLSEKSFLMTFLGEGSSSFQKLISLVLLRPRELGFVLTEPKKAQDLAKLAMRVLCRLMEICPAVKTEFVQLLKSLMGGENPAAYDLRSLSFDLEKSGRIEGLGFEDAMSLLKGYQQLNQAGVLLAVIGKESAAVMGEQVMLNVFRIDQECPPGLEPIASEILALSMCLGVRVRRLLDLVLDEKPISSQRNNTQKLTAGEVFYVNFRRTIVQQVKFFYRECLALLLKAAAAGNRTSRLLLTALLDDYLKPGGMGDSITKGSFLKEFLQHLPALAPSCTPEAFLVQKQFFLEVLHKLLLMDTAHDTVLLHSQPWFAFIMDTFIRFLHGSHVEVSDSSFGRSAVFALKCSSIALIPFFFNSSLDQNLKETLSNSLRRVVADHLLVRDADLPRGSNQRSSYVQMLSTLLGAISRSKSLELLEVLFPLLQTPTKLSGKLISETVDAFSKFIGERRTEAFDLCYRVINDSSKTPLLRRSILESVFGPLVNASPPSSVTSWYAEHMKSFLESLQMNYNTIDAEKWAEEVTTKICHFGLVELLYSRVKVQLIRDEINPVVEKDLILKAYAATRPPKGHMDDTPFPEHEKEWRDLHIAAYNCLAAVLTCTKESMAHFSALTEDKPGRFRWRYLIDLNKVYDNLAVETSQTIAANQAVRGLAVERKARQMRAAGATSGVNATLSSQYMVTASLSQEPALITSFVGGHANHPVAAESLDSSLLLGEDEEGLVSSTEGNDSEQREDPGSSEHVIDAAVIDQDDFDQHPCMRVILHVIQHLHSKFGEVYRGSQTMPDWMQLLHNTFDNSCTHINVRLFLAKVVTKARAVFAPYASAWFQPYIQTILQDPEKSGGLSFHYMLRDICITILQWKMPAPPDNGLATKFVQHLIRVAGHRSSQVLRANVDIIRLFLENWKDGIALERKAILHYLVAGGRKPDMNNSDVKQKRLVGLQLLGAVVASGFPIYDPANDPTVLEHEIAEALFNNLTVRTKYIYEAAAELLGIVLKHRSEFKELILDQFIETRLTEVLKDLYNASEFDRFLNILDKCTVRFPKFLEGFGYLVVEQVPRLYGVYKSIALDILLRNPSCDGSLFNQILPSLPKVLTHRDEIAQLKLLQLLAELLKEVSEDKISERVLPVLCDTFGVHENVDCRKLYYDILIFLHQSKRMSGNQRLCQSLLLGLCDRSDVVKESLQRFWHTQLSQDVGERFTQLVKQMYDPTIEEHWAQSMSFLFLKLCEDSVDFRRPIFTAPLADCEFHEYSINTSWTAGASLPMTPLFSNTQLHSGPTSMEPSQGGLSSLPGSERNNADDVTVSKQQQLPSGMIRATMTPSLSLAFTQTQGGGGGGFSSTLEGATGSSALFAMSQRSATTDYTQSVVQEGKTPLGSSTNLRRRILHPAAAHSQVLSGVIRANRRREARAAIQALERANKVHMMRHYRTGELPDIEIKYEEILRPLAALAEQDAIFARLLLTLLCKAVYCLPSVGRDIRADVRIGLEAALQRTCNGISFVSCVQSLCLQDPEIWISPKLVGSVSRKSTNLHSGILLLENEIMHETFPEPTAERNKKRHRGQGGQINLEQQQRPLEDAWLELAQLYKVVGEEDIVLALFQKHLTKHEITHRALEAQLGGDFEQANALYDKLTGWHQNGALEGAVSSTEIDMWYNERLSCLMELNNWNVITQETLMEITDDGSEEPQYQQLWQPERQDPYLSLFIRGALKVTTHHTSLMEFIQASFEDPIKREVLLKEFGTYLATAAIVNSDWDRACFLLGQCYRNFRKRWSALHPLAVWARHLEVRQLQKIIELDEFLNVIVEGKCKDFPRLVQEWQERWPSSQLDDVEAWDDIVQNRLIFFQKFQDTQVQTGTDGTQGGDGGKISVAKLSAERSLLYFKAAHGLMKRKAYTVAEAYMSAYLDSEGKAPNKDKLYYAFFKSFVKLRCLQADRLGSLEERVERLQEVLDYINKQERQLMQAFKILEGNVSAQLAWVKIESISMEDAESSKVKTCLSLLGSAFKAYSTAVSQGASAQSKSSMATSNPRAAAKASLKFGLFCDELLRVFTKPKTGDKLLEGIEDERQPSSQLLPASQYPSLVVRHMLKALALDSSLQAQHSVARLLSLIGQYPETHGEFQQLVSHVSSWVFIAWIPQMLAVMDEKEGAALVGVLESIAESYPQSLYFAFHVSKTDFKVTGSIRTQRLESLLRNTRLQGVIRGLEDLTYPEQRMRDGLLRIMSFLHSGDPEKAQACFHEMYEDCLDTHALNSTNRLSGEYNLKLARDWAPRIVKEMGHDGSKLLSVDPKTFSASMSKLLEQLARSIPGGGRSSLATISKWLADFDQFKGLEGHRRDGKLEGWRIEIPGQYNGLKAPDLRSNVLLMGFDQVLITLKSKQRPKLLTMRGSDEKEYKFVVKGGEDLRLDQRIEQLFEVMNGVLTRDSACFGRRLSIRTYAVIPVSKKCGLLQFVENTSTLEDVMKDGLSSHIAALMQQGQKPAEISPDKWLAKVQEQYAEWVGRRGGTKNMMENYHNLYKKADHKEVSLKLDAFRAQLPRDALRMGFSRLATSAESYLALRSNFSRSLAVLSICGYIAGVGDRHLANTLVDMWSGTLVPIDFGYSFGTNVLLLPVPELVPFRLTSQLTNFLLPLDAVGLLRSDMVRIMAALHGSRDIISAVMEVFVKEPLVDWKQEAVKLKRARGTRVGGPTSSGSGLEEIDLQEATNPEQEHVELKVENAQHKLELWNPAEITIAELWSSVHANKPYTRVLEAIIRGDPQRNARAQVPGKVCRTVQEQVDCLIDQATDPNLLGRIYVGWQPWV